MIKERARAFLRHVAESLPVSDSVLDGTNASYHTRRVCWVSLKAGKQFEGLYNFAGFLKHKKKKHIQKSQKVWGKLGCQTDVFVLHNLQS